MFMFTFSMVINRNIECMQMTPLAACAWSVAGKSHARFDLDIDLLQLNDVMLPLAYL